MKQKGKLLSFLILSWIFCIAFVTINANIDYGIQTTSSQPEHPIETAKWDEYGNPISTLPTDQVSPKIAAVGEGSAIIVWTNVNDIYAQKISALGVNQWTDDGIPAANDTNQEGTPEICADLSGGAIIVYYKYFTGPLERNVYAQRIDSSGQMMWGLSGKIVCSAVANQDAFKICSDGVGGVIVAWEDERNGNLDIYAQRLNATGDIQWAPNGTLICDAVGEQHSLAIVSDQNEGALISWTDNRTGEQDIYVLRIQNDGNRHPSFSIDGTPVCMASGSQFDSVIASDGDQGAILAWTDKRSSISYDIYAARITKLASKPWGTDGIPVCTAANSQSTPQICSANNSGAIITWSDYRIMVSNIYAQLLNATGHSQWTGNGTVICDATGDQILPKICPDGRGGAFIAWEDERSGTNSDIYVAHIAESGYMKWVDGTPKCTVTGNQQKVQIARVLLGSAILTWTDYRTGNPDIYAASISILTESGNIPGFNFIFILLSFFGLMAIISMLNKKKIFSNFA